MQEVLAVFIVCVTKETIYMWISCTSKQETCHKRQTCVGFRDPEGEKPRLSLTPFPLPALKVKLELSETNQASQVSSIPVKRACNPYATNHFSDNIQIIRVFFTPWSLYVCIPVWCFADQHGQQKGLKVDKSGDAKPGLNKNYTIKAFTIQQSNITYEASQKQ